MIKIRVSGQQEMETPTPSQHSPASVHTSYLLPPTITYNTLTVCQKCKGPGDKNMRLLPARSLPGAQLGHRGGQAGQPG